MQRALRTATKPYPAHPQRAAWRVSSVGAYAMGLGCLAPIYSRRAAGDAEPSSVAYVGARTPESAPARTPRTALGPYPAHPSPLRGASQATEYTPGPGMPRARLRPGMPRARLLARGKRLKYRGSTQRGGSLHLVGCVAMSKEITGMHRKTGMAVE
ncbi:hypothetical protein C8F04DRAFT_1266093 [Mycena alexandri]|uniref:Uncharacterized protein n=1 Tax=Mycena alexandri TaxID=1745969 RepID=A0AAD6SIZ1_9AGAR|nr:hypothetical protein C8F04DRAFT_1266093 [Mycena alexandri]